MYRHIKKLMYTVNVGTPDPRFGNMLLEQFGGANGELAAAMQYSIQGLNCDDLERKDLLMDIGTEELSHLEIVGTLAKMHLKPMKTDRDAAEADPLIAIAGGGGVGLFNRARCPRRRRRRGAARSARGAPRRTRRRRAGRSLSLPRPTVSAVESIAYTSPSCERVAVDDDEPAELARRRAARGERMPAGARGSSTPAAAAGRGRRNGRSAR